MIGRVSSKHSVRHHFLQREVTQSKVSHQRIHLRPNTFRKESNISKRDTKTNNPVRQTSLRSSKISDFFTPPPNSKRSLFSGPPFRNRRKGEENNSKENNSSPSHQQLQKLQQITQRRPLFFPRIQYFLNRWKPWTGEQIWTLLSFFAVGTSTLLILFTTTIVGLFLWLANTLDFDDYVTQRISVFLTKSSGINITYETAEGSSVLKEGKIRLKNVEIHRDAPVGDENHSIIDLTIEEIAVKLSASWFLEGRGLVKEIVVKGVRGVVDRRTEKPDAEWLPVRRKWQRGDFELSRFIGADALITLYPPDPSARPLEISIFSIDCNLFRKQWLLYDLLRANNIIGTLYYSVHCINNIIGIFDGCLFTYGPSQRRLTYDEDPSRREMTLKIDGINTDMLSKNSSGPLGWIKEGTFDVSMNILLPKQIPMTKDIQYLPPDYHSNSTTATPVPQPQTSRYDMTAYDDELEFAEQRTVDVRTNIRLNHIKLSPPMYTPEIGWLDNAVIHPISMYMNAHTKHLKLPVNFSVPEEHFDGSWTPGEAGIWEHLSESAYNSLNTLVEEQKRDTDFKKVMGYVWKYFFQ